MSKRRTQHAKTVLQTVLILPLAVALHGGCSEESTAIRIKLIADPAINTEAQVLAVIDRIELVLDAAGGLNEGTSELTARDADADGESELVFADRSVGGASSFPLYRLRAGSMAERAFTVAARGTVGAQLAAVGQPVNARFEQAKDLELSVPLDLRADYRPPHVLTTLPQDGQDTVPPALGTVHVVFSKWIATKTIKDNLTLVYRSPSGKETPVPGDWSLVNTSVTEEGQPGARALASVDLGSCALNPGTYLISAGTAITDVDGVGLDQRPATESAEPFSATFTLPGTATDEPCSASPQPGCTKDEQCNLEGAPQRYVCAKDSGRCVPAPASCESLISCPKGYRCVEDGDKVRCEADHVEPPPPPPPPTCDSANPCPDGYRCEGGGEDPFLCLDDSIGCNDAPNICPKTTRCNEGNGRCQLCEVYPSPGCEIECTEGGDQCPHETECNLDTFLCKSVV